MQHKVHTVTIDCRSQVFHWIFYYLLLDMRLSLYYNTTLRANLPHCWRMLWLLGRDLWVLALGRSPGIHVSLRPNVKFVGTIHGNEVVFHSVLSVLCGRLSL